MSEVPLYRFCLADCHFYQQPIAAQNPFRKEGISPRRYTSSICAIYSPPPQNPCAFWNILERLPECRLRSAKRISGSIKFLPLGGRSQATCARFGGKPHVESVPGALSNTLLSRGAQELAEVFPKKPNASV